MRDWSRREELNLHLPITVSAALPLSYTGVTVHVYYLQSYLARDLNYPMSLSPKRKGESAWSRREELNLHLPITISAALSLSYTGLMITTPAKLHTYGAPYILVSRSGKSKLVQKPAKFR